MAVGWSGCLLIAVCGCGGGSKGSDLEMIPVTGIVRLDNQPLAAATVMFNPLPGTKGNGAYGVTDNEGKFTLIDFHEIAGCPPGEYAVTFSKITQPDGSPIPPGAQRGEVGMEEQIPKAYSVFQPESIVTSATVSKPSGNFEFVLDSKRKPPPGMFN
ncbi:MAG: hypothetical protein B7Z55_02825 [Planctomycetales bacterium 12-60-4]|nr:MAG: hypothetical protein B7Z55_02825 [Planctomycetales bacterium 12-60-4]